MVGVCCGCSRKVAWMALTLISLGFAAGCGDSGPPRLDLVEVDGQLQVDGKPFGPVMTIDFVPVDPPESSEASLPAASGPVADDGTFQLKTYEEGDGIPEGKYQVTITGDIMEATQPPATLPLIVEIKKPEGGGALKLEIKLESDPSGGSLVDPGSI
jgi:hypothetical protein